MKIVVFDIETTGLDKEKDHIIQFSAVKHDTENPGKKEIYETYIQPTGNYSMSLVAYSKHRISPEFLKDKPYFVDVAYDIMNFLEGCVLLTYNGLSFDAPFLKKEFKEVGLTWNFSESDFYDAFLEEKRRNSNALDATYLRYTGKTMEEAGLSAHNSTSDCLATLEIFLAQQKEKEYGPEEILTEDGFIKNMDFAGKVVECFAHGKYSGTPLVYVAKNDRSYLSWVINNAGFDIKTRKICEKYLA